MCFIMKKLKFIFIFTFLIFFSLKPVIAKNLTVFDHEFEDIDGNLVQLSKFQGKPLFLVNTASRCGFTPQYEGLQQLFNDYRKTDLTILATTSNSFNQEYSSNEEIKKFCLVNYDIGFITSSPIMVKGENAHPLFKWIKEEYNKQPRWNFYKYLFDRDGFLVKSWSSMTKPDSYKITKQIDKLI